MLQTRLTLLANASMISEETKEIMTHVIEMLQKKYNIILTEENGAMMVTHLAMAITRVKKGAPVIALDDELYQELLAHHALTKAQEIYQAIEIELGMTLPVSEQKYMLINLCILLDK